MCRRGLCRGRSSTVNVIPVIVGLWIRRLGSIFTVYFLKIRKTWKRHSLSVSSTSLCIKLGPSLGLVCNSCSRVKRVTTDICTTIHSILDNFNHILILVIYTCVMCNSGRGF